MVVACTHRGRRLPFHVCVCVFERERDRVERIVGFRPECVRERERGTEGETERAREREGGTEGVGESLTPREKERVREGERRERGRGRDRG